MEEEITFLAKLINNIINYIGGNQNAVVFASILSFTATVLLVIVTIVYVVFVRNSNIFSKEYAKFKVTDDIGKESEHEITNAIEFVESYYNKDVFFDPDKSDLTKNERIDYLKDNYNKFYTQIKVIYNYFSRVYLYYKYNKTDSKILFDQLSPFITSYKQSHHDIIVEYYESSIGILNRARFEKLFKLCEKYIWDKNK